MADYKMYLASSILTEDKIITYRLLSRALKVHVNAAKEMLYEFHRQQNGKKPGTIHATYLLSGTKRQEKPIPTIAAVKKDGEDDYMQSSPYLPSSMPPFDEGTGESSVLSITLVKEEDLEEARSQYEHISSIHIYSIGPTPIKDLQMLSDVTREVQVLTKSEDSLEFASKYGTITNKNVKRRTGRRPPVPSSTTVPVQAQPAHLKVEVKESPKPASKPDTKSTQPSTARDFFGKGKEKAKDKAPATKATGAGSAPSSKESTPAPTAPPALKRESSSIFKSFAKAKPKLKREGTDSSAAPSVAEDSPMRDVSDDDEEDTYVAPPPKVKTKSNDPEGGEDRKTRKVREAALKAMMDTDDEDEEEIKAAPKSKKEVKDEEEPDVEMMDEDEPEKEEVEKEAEAPAASSGRRRGKKRVMKKKTVKDEDGYLVTREEPVWESFSEDEPVAAPKLKSQSSFSAGAKPKKGPAKVGQGNIMSFFGKK